MTAAKVNLKEGKKVPIGSSWAVIIIFFQAAIAIFAQFIKERPVVLLREFGFVIFALLTVYFYWLPRNQKKKEIIKKEYFDPFLYAV
jgi:hypothetical protein